MGGIAGILSFNKKLRISRDLQTVKSMCGVIRHRGPDIEGYYSSTKIIMGNVSKKAEKLPVGKVLSNKNESIYIAWDGQLWNQNHVGHLEGNKHYSNDAQMVIDLYEKLGSDFVKELDGSFAFALFDEEKECLLLIRDRFGSKPLYYVLMGDKVYFSSEIKGVLQVPSIPREVNPEAVVDYFFGEFLYGDKTFFRGIKNVPPSTIVQVNIRRKALSLVKYWDFSLGKKTKIRETRYYSESYEKFLKRSLMLRLLHANSSEVGFLLSGGIDSSAIVAMASEMVPKSDKLHTYTCTAEGLKEKNDAPYARALAEALGTDHCELLLSAEDNLKHLPHLVWYEDEPIWPVYSLPLYVLIERLKEDHINIAVTGTGGTLFYGVEDLAHELFFRQMLYDFLKKREINCPFNNEKMSIFRCLFRIVKMWFGTIAKAGNPLSKVPFKELVYDLVPQGVELGVLFEFLQGKRVFERSFLKEVEGYYHIINRENCLKESRKNGPLYAYLYDGCRYMLPVLQILEDKVANAFSISVVQPLMDNAMVEFAQDVPPSIAVKNFVSKYIPKEALSGKVPENILSRKKVGFGYAPSLALGKPEDFAKAKITQVLTDPNARYRKYLNPKYVMSYLEKYYSGQVDVIFLWRLLLFEIWHRTFIDPDNPPRGPVAV